MSKSVALGTSLIITQIFSMYVCLTNTTAGDLLVPTWLGKCQNTVSYARYMKILEGKLSNVALGTILGMCTKLPVFQ